ncbi:hypothetical protein TWF718_006705 [Orbilia javanica]|uniref:Uncharacterized protein n=1 Tax=Orbilia javanica TaxID=47235 RepID=A0AAN8MT28_9PEZI
MPDPIGVQVDITNVPGALSALGSMAPLLRALSADGANPLAVVQLEAIGSRFPISGPLANRTVGALTRTGSGLKFWRAQVAVGWMRGDTTWALSQTAGGQASALLTACLVELYCKDTAGRILFGLSKKILPRDRCLSNVEQLSDLAEIVSSRMQRVRFGQHLAEQVTRIRMTYLNSGIEIPRSDSASLLNRISVDSLVDILDKAQTALQDETVILRIEGFAGIAFLVALFTGICEDDVLLLVENEVIFKGARSSIIISVVHGKRLEVSKEAAFDLPKQIDIVSLRKECFLGQLGRVSEFDRLTIEKEGCLGAMVMNPFSYRVPTFQLLKEQGAVLPFENLVGAMIGLAFQEPDCGIKSDFLEGSFRFLLSTSVLTADNQVRKRIGVLFDIDLDLGCSGAVSRYHKIRPTVAHRTCSKCPDLLYWDDLHTEFGLVPRYYKVTLFGLEREIAILAVSEQDCSP